MLRMYPLLLGSFGLFYYYSLKTKNLSNMKLKYLAIALFPLTLIACQSSDIQKVGDTAVSVLQQHNADKTLVSYQWSADTPNAPKPLVLNFSETGRLSISTSCNTLGSSWSVENNTISTGDMMSTLMACAENATAQEGLAGQIFADRKVPFVLNLNDKENPTLTLTNVKGEKIIFTAKASIRLASWLRWAIMRSSIWL